jgi:hypothetical protein
LILEPTSMFFLKKFLNIFGIEVKYPMEDQNR